MIAGLNKTATTITHVRTVIRRRVTKVYPLRCGYHANRILGAENSLTEEQLMMCSPLVYSYCLKTKHWGKSLVPCEAWRILMNHTASFFVDNIHEISWNDKAFESLILVHDYKELIRALVDNQLNQHARIDDVIEGKGIQLDSAITPAYIFCSDRA